jgi:hypothetical protein
MKIDDITTQRQLDELDAAQAGNTVGSKVRAVGAGVSNFAKGFAQGFMGKKPGPGTPASNQPLDTIKDAISKLSPKQRAAIRTQIAKKAGVQ